VAKRLAIFRTGALETGRVEAFSDGVMAVAITLLVLGIQLPADLKTDAALWAAIGRIVPALATWVVSFAFVLTFWVSHHYFFAGLKKTDRGLLWLNGLFLLCITLVPFPTGLVGLYPGFTAPLALLSGVMLLTSLSFAAMRFYASFHGRLLRDELSEGEARTAMLQSAVAPVLYALAVGLSFLWPPGAMGIQILVLALFFLRSASRHPALEPET
jgi:uncharacterized membrane protein